MSNQRALQNATAPGIALAHTLAGEHKAGVGGVTHAAGNVQQAGLHSTAPYKPPRRRVQDDAKRETPLCEVEGCKAWPMKRFPVCSGHARSQGLVKNWSTNPEKNKPDAAK